MRNIFSAFQNLMSLKQAGSRSKPEPVKSALFRCTRTEPEPFKFEIIEPKPNPNL